MTSVATSQNWKKKILLQCSKNLKPTGNRLTRNPNPEPVISGRFGNSQESANIIFKEQESQPVLCGYLTFEITNGFGSLKCSESKNYFFWTNQNQRNIGSDPFRNIEESIVFMRNSTKKNSGVCKVVFLNIWIFFENQGSIPKLVLWVFSHLLSKWVYTQLDNWWVSISGRT
jgi:hypothetical protein